MLTTMLVWGMVIGFLGAAYFVSPFFHSGGDGLGGWIELIFCCLLFVGCAIGLLVLKIADMSSFSFLQGHTKLVVVCIALTPVALLALWLGYMLYENSRSIAESNHVWETTTSLVTFTSEKLGVTFPYANKLRTGNYSIEVQETEKEAVLKTLSEGEMYARITTLTNTSTMPAEQFLNEYTKNASINSEVAKQEVHPFSRIEAGLPVYKIVQGVTEFKEKGELFPTMYYHRSTGELGYTYDPSPANGAEDEYRVRGKLVDFTSDVYFIETKPNTFLAIAFAEYSAPYGILSDDAYDTSNTAKWYRYMTIIRS